MKSFDKVWMDLGCLWERKVWWCFGTCSRARSTRTRRWRRSRRRCVWCFLLRCLWVWKMKLCVWLCCCWCCCCCGINLVKGVCNWNWLSTSRSRSIIWKCWKRKLRWWKRWLKWEKCMCWLENVVSCVGLCVWLMILCCMFWMWWMRTACVFANGLWSWWLIYFFSFLCVVLCVCLWVIRCCLWKYVWFCCIWFWMVVCMCSWLICLYFISILKSTIIRAWRLKTKKLCLYIMIVCFSCKG